jgi:hypothetical protein
MLNLRSITPIIVGTASALALSVLGGWPEAAMAGYNPPKRPGPKITVGTGARGCDKPLSVPLTPLAPDGHIGQTAQDYPTFMWYIEDTKPVEFTLVEPGIPQPIYVATVQPEKPGIVQVTLPEKSAIKLVPGKEYRWSVAIICNPLRRSEDAGYTQAWIRREAASPELQKRLAEAKTDLERATLYAESGMWYDSLAAYYRAKDQDNTAKTNLVQLLEQGGRTDVAKQQLK